LEEQDRDGMVYIGSLTLLVYLNERGYARLGIELENTKTENM
jgi:hypothetical protein